MDQAKIDKIRIALSNMELQDLAMLVETLGTDVSDAKELIIEQLMDDDVESLLTELGNNFGCDPEDEIW